MKQQFSKTIKQIYESLFDNKDSEDILDNSVLDEYIYDDRYFNSYQELCNNMKPKYNKFGVLIFRKINGNGFIVSNYTYDNTDNETIVKCIKRLNKNGYQLEFINFGNNIWVYYQWLGIDNEFPWCNYETNLQFDNIDTKENNGYKNTQLILNNYGKEIKNTIFDNIRKSEYDLYLPSIYELNDIFISKLLKTNLFKFKELERLIIKSGDEYASSTQAQKNDDRIYVAYVDADEYGYDEAYKFYMFYSIIFNHFTYNDNSSNNKNKVNESLFDKEEPYDLLNNNSILDNYIKAEAYFDSVDELKNNMSEDFNKYGALLFRKNNKFLITNYINPKSKVKSLNEIIRKYNKLGYILEAINISKGWMYCNWIGLKQEMMWCNDESNLYYDMIDTNCENGYENTKLIIKEYNWADNLVKSIFEHITDNPNKYDLYIPATYELKEIIYDLNFNELYKLEELNIKDNMLFWSSSQYKSLDEDCSDNAYYRVFKNGAYEDCYDAKFLKCYSIALIHFDYKKELKGVYESLFDDEENNDLLDTDSVLDDYVADFTSVSDLLNNMNDKYNIYGAMLFRNKNNQFMIDNYENTSLLDDDIDEIYFKHKNKGYELEAVCLGNGMWKYTNYYCRSQYIDVRSDDVSKLNLTNDGYTNTKKILNYATSKNCRSNGNFNIITENITDYDLYIPSIEQYKKVLNNTNYDGESYFIKEFADLNSLECTTSLKESNNKRYPYAQVYCANFMNEEERAEFAVSLYDKETGLYDDYNDYDEDIIIESSAYDNIRRKEEAPLIYTSYFIKFKNVTITI